MEKLSTQDASVTRAERLAEEYRSVRRFSERICEPLTAEDCAIQSMPDVSPTRWHLAHTTWFFETFALASQGGYRAYHPEYAYLFNSYYNTLGAQFPRPRRGLLSRPGLEDVCAYRRYVDENMLELLQDGDRLTAPLADVIEVGLNHEQQHQELMFTDIKHVFSVNPLFPHYHAGTWTQSEAVPQKWLGFDEGLHWIGHEGEAFAYDNETPRHRLFLEPFRLSNRPVTCGEFLDFMEQRGYERPELWLSLGWQHINEHNWRSPLYWTEREGQWFQFTLVGLREVDRGEPVCHVSFFEADAYARWAGARLPTEAEWEVAAAGVPLKGNFANTLLDAGRALHPSSRATGETGLSQMFGDVWEWTASPYTAYPGFEPPKGALGEYNGKFMCNQYVLRGGSCATPSGHIRSTYRNFFPPEARWQFMGIRLAQSD